MTALSVMKSVSKKSAKWFVTFTNFGQVTILTFTWEQIRKKEFIEIGQIWWFISNKKRNVKAVKRGKTILLNELVTGKNWLAHKYPKPVENYHFWVVVSASYRSLTVLIVLDSGILILLN